MMIDQWLGQGLITLVTVVTTGGIAYLKLKKKAETSFDQQSQRIRQQVENSIWLRIQEQMKDLEDKLDTCEEHRAKEGVILQRMRLAFASMELVVIRLKQELERRGIVIPQLHILADLAGDDPMFAAMLEKVDKQFQKNSTRPVSSAVEQVIKENGDGSS